MGCHLSRWLRWQFASRNLASSAIAAPCGTWFCLGSLRICHFSPCYNEPLSWDNLFGDPVFNGLRVHKNLYHFRSEKIPAWFRLQRHVSHWRCAAQGGRYVALRGGRYVELHFAVWDAVDVPKFLCQPTGNGLFTCIHPSSSNIIQHHPTSSIIIQHHHPIFGTIFSSGLLCSEAPNLHPSMGVATCEPLTSSIPAAWHILFSPLG